MIKKEKVIAFDLDGTLINSAPDITSALNYVLIKNHLKPVSTNKVRNLIGNGAKALIRDSFLKQKSKIDNLDKLTFQFLSKYKKCFKEKTKLYPNTKTTVRLLHKNGYKLILVSNKPEYYCIELLIHFGLLNYFVSVSGGDTFSYKKPNPKHLYNTIKKAGVKDYKCIFVGDSIYDLQCANNANIPCILLSHGYNKINVNHLGAYKVIDNFKYLFDEVEFIYREL